MKSTNENLRISADTAIGMLFANSALAYWNKCISTGENDLPDFSKNDSLFFCFFSDKMGSFIEPFEFNSANVKSYSFG